jgi:hypothetical protein
MPVSGEIPNQQTLLALLAAAQLMVAPDATVVTIAPPLRNCSVRAARGTTFRPKRAHYRGVYKAILKADAVLTHRGHHVRLE